MYKLRETIHDKDQHLRCINYSGNYDKALIRLVNMDVSYNFEREVAEPEVIMVCEGTLQVTLDGAERFSIASGKMYFLPAGTHVYVSTVENATVVLLQLDISENMCSRFAFSELAKYRKDISAPLNALPMRSCIRIFLFGLLPFLEDGLLCSHYLKAKINEFIHIFRSYYSKEDQAAFFYRMLGEDVLFINFISRNIRRVKSVEELARLANMSRNGFIDKFKRKVGQSPAAYLKERKKEFIKTDLLNTEIPLKEVAARNGYDHYEVFSKFCKKNLGHSPSEIRQYRK